MLTKKKLNTGAENMPVCIILDKERNKLSDVLINLIFAHHYKIELHTLDIDWKLTATATPGSTQMVSCYVKVYLKVLNFSYSKLKKSLNTLQ